jgi:hypothetical protein
MTKTSAAKNKVKVATALALLPTTNKKAKPNGKGRKGASSSPPPSKRSRSSKKQDDIPHRMIILMIVEQRSTERSPSWQSSILRSIAAPEQSQERVERRVENTKE